METAEDQSKEQVPVYLARILTIHNMAPLLAF